ncbi:MAG TPA: glutaredoxin family protein [Spirochaetia bacterium]|nr:glutaredoxin family protein [Spirochaetia bacterium]
MSKKVTLYTKTGCPYCAKALEHYGAERYTIEEINLSERVDQIPRVKQLTGDTKVPVIVEDGNITVGFAGGG